MGWGLHPGKGLIYFLPEASQVCTGTSWLPMPWVEDSEEQHRAQAI